MGEEEEGVEERRKSRSCTSELLFEKRCWLDIYMCEFCPDDRSLRFASVTQQIRNIWPLLQISIVWISSFCFYWLSKSRHSPKHELVVSSSLRKGGTGYINDLNYRYCGAT